MPSERPVAIDMPVIAWYSGSGTCYRPALGQLPLQLHDPIVQALRLTLEPRQRLPHGLQRVGERGQKRA